MKKKALVVIFDREDSHTKMSEKLMKDLGNKTGFKLIKYNNLHRGVYVYILKIDNS